VNTWHQPGCAVQITFRAEDDSEGKRLPSWVRRAALSRSAMTRGVVPSTKYFRMQS